MPQVNRKYLEIKEIENSLSDLIKKENIVQPNIKVISGNIQGDGYMGMVNIIELADLNSNSDRKTFNLVLKYATNNVIIRESMPIRKAFLNEIYVYENIFPEFAKFYTENQLSINNDKNFITTPKFYGCNRTELHESLVLENMKVVDYQMWNRMLPMDDDHIDLILKNYSKLHSVSFAMKKKDNVLFERLTRNLPDIFDYMKTNGQHLFEKAIANIVQNLDGKIDEKILKKVEEFGYGIDDFLTKLKEDDDYAVVIHGDCWNNNFLFKYRVTT